MDIITRFKELAKEFQQDELYLRYIAAKQANDGDQELQSAIGEFNLVRLDLNNEMDKENRDQQRIAALNEKVNRLYSDIMGNRNMIAYNDAKQEVENFMNYVNEILNAALQGEDPMAVQPPADGCDPADCSSCGGGCG